MTRRDEGHINIAPISAQSIYFQLQKKYGLGVIDVIDDPQDDWNIIVFVKNASIKLPNHFEGRRVIVYNLSSVRSKCTKMLKRIKEENINTTDESNRYFVNLMSEGHKICSRLVAIK